MSSEETYTALVVDDSPDVCRLLKRALKGEGVECDTVPDGVAAMERLEASRYDIVISDLRMPRMHGHKLMMELKGAGRDIPFVVITGVTDARVIKDLYNRGAIDVITKPFNFVLLAVRIRHLLRKRGELSESTGAPGDMRQQLSEQLTGTANLLQEKLAEVTRSFETTISDLNKQRDILESGYLGSVRILANLIEQVGHSGRSHATRVESAANGIAQLADYPPHALLNLKIGALLHEIGAFGMPDAIRHKPPWSLDAEERKFYDRYPDIGAVFLSELKDGKPVVELVENHAENFDGTGIPARKKGEQIPLGARILRVADGCDTFLMHNPDGDRVQALHNHLLQERGRMYDPALVPLAVEYFDERLRSESTAFPVSVAELREGLVTAENVYDDEGRFLAREGVELSGTLIQRIKSLIRHSEIRVREQE
ncbi:MAG: response regulator [Candidatus Hydrogenedentes bacterium]|nr:response regulator [Candidatus Hydrogenedentota bacterium]